MDTAYNSGVRPSRGRDPPGQVGAPDRGDPDANSSNRAHADGLG